MPIFANGIDMKSPAINDTPRLLEIDLEDKRNNRALNTIFATSDQVTIFFIPIEESPLIANMVYRDLAPG